MEGCTRPYDTVRVIRVTRVTRVTRDISQDTLRIAHAHRGIAKPTEGGRGCAHGCEFACICVCRVCRGCVHVCEFACICVCRVSVRVFVLACVCMS